MIAYAQWPPNAQRPRSELARPGSAPAEASSIAVRLRAARVQAFLGGSDAEPTDEIGRLISKTAKLFAESITPETRKDYARRWAKWVMWCEKKGFEPLDSPAEVVMMFLADHIGDRGAALGTLRSYMAAINRVHVEAGLVPPGDDPAMSMFLRTMKRAVPPKDPQGEISALKIGPLRDLCRYLDLVGPDVVEIRDRALFALHAGGAGDGEIARLRWADVRLADKRATILLRSIRADRSDRTLRLDANPNVAVCPVRALQLWRGVGGTDVPWVITKIVTEGSREEHAWTPRDIFRIRKARAVALGRGDERATPEQVLTLLGGARPDVLRDKALVLVGFAGAFRRPDLLGFRWSDVTQVDNGLVLRLRKSKTDRLGEGVDVGVPRGASTITDPVHALLAWRDRVERQLGADFVSDGPCFGVVGRSGRIGVEPLTDTALSAMITARMNEAGIEGRWSGRSLRRGFISTAADMGLRLEDIAKGSRHATLDSLIRYIATDDPFRNKPAAQMGL